MGIFKKPKYEETETDKQIKRQLADEEKDRIKKETKRKEYNKRQLVLIKLNIQLKEL